MFPLLLPRRPRPEEVAAAHARLVALGFALREDETVVTGGWVPETNTVTEEPADEASYQPRQVDAPTRFVTPRLLDRVAMRPAAAVGLAVVAVVAVVIAAAIAWHARARPVTSVAPPAISGAASASPRASVGSVVVDVVGKVRRPGLVTLPTGSRVADAIRAAGGARPGTDLATLNLARKLIDGEQVVVGAKPSAAAPPGSGGVTGGSTQTGAVVDLNAATTADFDTLPGIGPVLAQRIVDFRTSHGGFTDVTQLRQVSGIGDSKYAQIKDLVQV